MTSSEQDQVEGLPNAQGTGGTPPPPNQGPQVHSTPAGKGTASAAQHKLESKVTVGENPGLIDQDLSTTQTVPLITMLRAMIMKKRVVECGNDLEYDALERLGRSELQALIEASVDFCNKQDSAKLKDKVTAVLNCSNENGCYLPLSIGLNSVLLRFDKQDIGALGAPKTEDAVIYAVNDPTIIKSRPVSEHATGTNTKPDVCLFRLNSLRKLVANDIPNATLHHIASLIDHADGNQLSTKVDGEAKINWSDIVSCIELKRNAAWKWVHAERLNQPYDVNSMMITEHQGFSKTAEDPPAVRSNYVSAGGGVASSSANVGSTAEGSGAAKGKTRKRKRPTNSNHDSVTSNAPSKKKPRTAKSSSKAHSSNAPNVNSRRPGDASSRKLPPDTQCAVYGIELLRSRWDKTHSIVLLLRDSLLSLRWYDSQGCIATTDVDITEHLPLLVAVVILMQRFKEPMRGLPTVDFKANIDGKEIPFDIPSDTHTRWEMKGRRPATGFPVAKGRAHHAEPNAPLPTRPTRSNSGRPELPEGDAGDLADLFFKWSWREETRDREDAIIATAKERAQQYLPEEHVGDILNHLPEVKYAQEFEIHSTGHIRKYAGIPTRGARVPSMILFKKLRPIDEIGAIELAKKMWDVIRCSWLLWAIGVAHGDISYWNIMLDPTTNKLILNDFDLATLMEPGDESPFKRGFERTGTKPFMALELMKATDGRVKRTRRHELESFIWIFAWVCEGDESEERWSWNHPSFDQARLRKGEYWRVNLGMNEPPSTLGNADKVVWDSLCEIAMQWSIMDMRGALRKTTAAPTQFLLALDQQFAREPQYKTWDWIGFKVQRAT